MDGYLKSKSCFKDRSFQQKLTKLFSQNLMGSYPGVVSENLKNSKKSKFRTASCVTSPNHHEMETNPDLIPKQGKTFFGLRMR